MSTITISIIVGTAMGTITQGTITPAITRMNTATIMATITMVTAMI